jgi:hypothetical protein
MRRLGFRIEYCRDRIAAALPDHNNNLALAILVPCETTVTAVFFLIGGLHVAAEISTISQEGGDMPAIRFARSPTPTHLTCGSCLRYVPLPMSPGRICRRSAPVSLRS